MSLVVTLSGAALLGFSSPSSIQASTLDPTQNLLAPSTDDSTTNTLSSSESTNTSSTPISATTTSTLNPNEILSSAGSGQVTQTADGYEMTNSRLKVDIGRYGEISGLYIVGDKYNTNYVMNSKTSPTYDNGVNEWVGEIMFRTRSVGQTAWQKEYTANSSTERAVTLKDNKVIVTYTPTAKDTAENRLQNLQVTETYSLNANNQLSWQINVKNISKTNITVGDFGLPLPFNMYWGVANRYEDAVLIHSFVGQSASYIYLNRPSGVGNFLAMTPDASTGAGFEYKDNWSSTGELSSAEQAWAHKGDNGDWSDGLNVYYINSQAIKDSKDSKKLGSGYLPHTSLNLAPGEDKTYAFNFTASDLSNQTANSNSTSPDVDSSTNSVSGSASTTSATTNSDSSDSDVKFDQQLKSILYDNHVMDAVSVPSMILQKGSNGKADGKMYLHTQLDPDQISFDFQNKRTDLLDNTGINVSDNSAIGDTSASAKYDKATTYNGEKYLIYDVSFSSLGQNNIIVNYNYNGQPRKTTLQYYVMDNPKAAIERHAEWMVDNTQWTSGNMNGLYDDWNFDTQAKEGSYDNWGDDDGLTHGEFLALKNAIDPDKKQVESLDYYLDEGVWNNLMKDHHNDFRVPDFLDGYRGTVRGYAYPSIFNTYFQMYRIAKNYPNLVNALC